MARRDISTGSTAGDSPFLTPEEGAGVLASVPLSPRQKQIVQLILQARQHKQIATDLGLSPHTVRAYMRQIFIRMEVDDTLQLVLRLAAHLSRTPRP